LFADGKEEEEEEEEKNINFFDRRVGIITIFRMETC
jgi:hypothetical protein